LEGETGLLIPLEQQQEAPFDPVNPEAFSKDLADGINKVINNPELKATMARNGRKRVEKTFDWEAIAKQVEELYKSLK